MQLTVGNGRKRDGRLEAIYSEKQTFVDLAGGWVFTTEAV